MMRMICVVALLTTGCAGVGSMARPTPSFTKMNLVPDTTAAGKTNLPPQPSAAHPSNVAQVNYEGWTADCPTCATASGQGCVSAEPSCHPHAVAPGVLPWTVTQPTGIDPQEYLCNGGDRPPAARLSKRDRILGLDVQDTVTHYTTESGDIDFAASNRVCVYAPRFGAVRHVTGAVAGEHALSVVAVDRPVGPRRVDVDTPGVVLTDTLELAHAQLTRRVDAMRLRDRGVRIENIDQPELAEDVMPLLAAIEAVSPQQLDDAQLALIKRHAVAAIAWAIDESVEVEIQNIAPPTLTRDQSVESLVVYDFPDAGRLSLIKLADRGHAAPGEKVRFLLKLQNVGDSEVSHVVVTDNLTTRLQYVDGSQKASQVADFMTTSNEVGSSQVTWQLRKPLPVGGIVTFEFETVVR